MSDRVTIGVDYASPNGDVSALVEMRGDTVIAIETDPERIRRRLAWAQTRGLFRPGSVQILVPEDDTPPSSLSPGTTE